MPGYGMCSECGETVWLTESGACPKGHGPEHISGVVETAPPGAPGDDAKKTRALVIAAVVTVVLLLCCLVGGILVAIAIPVFNAASTTARESACFAQQRLMDGALEQWVIAEEGRSRSDLADYEAVVDAVVPEYVSVEQVCPTDGTYEYDPATDTISCSVHGEY